MARERKRYKCEKEGEGDKLKRGLGKREGRRGRGKEGNKIREGGRGKTGASEQARKREIKRLYSCACVYV